MKDQEIIKEIVDLIENYPNDMDLGKKVRSLLFDRVIEKINPDDTRD